MMTDTDHSLTIHAALYAQVTSLRARHKAASGYVCNQDMRIESNILAKQIAAVEAEMRGIERLAPGSFTHMCDGQEDAPDEY